VREADLKIRLCSLPNSGRILQPTEGQPGLPKLTELKGDDERINIYKVEFLS
jgi:hypothetical protein